jgi:hypothetical protein
MRLEIEAGLRSGSLGHLREAGRGDRGAALAKTKGDTSGSRAGAGVAPAARRPGSVRAQRAVLDPADVHHGAGVKSGPTSATS